MTQPKQNKTKHKSTLGCLTPLGQPRSVYKSDVECRYHIDKPNFLEILSQNGQNYPEGQG